MRSYEADVRRILARLPQARRADLPEIAARYCGSFHDFLKGCAEGRENRQSPVAREAGERLVKVFDEVRPLPILTRVSAMFLMRQQEPHAFRDERAFRFQLVRALRKLTSVADGVYWNHRAQRAQQIVKPIPAKVQEMMGEWLVEFAVPFVQHVTACAMLSEKNQTTRAFLATSVFAPMRDKLEAEHARLARKLQLARRLNEQKAQLS